MKRFHVHVAVEDLAVSTRFYSALFGMAPTVVKDDYTKWMLDDPKLNFAISSRGNAAGVNHLGFQAEDAAELAGIHQRLQQADGTVVAEAEANCCYAKSDKYWITDPSGIAWESFHTLDTIPTFNGGVEVASTNVVAPTTMPAPAMSACCAPALSVAPLRMETGLTPTKGACCG